MIFISKPTCSNANTKVNGSETIPRPSTELLNAYLPKKIKNIRNKITNAASCAKVAIPMFNRWAAKLVKNGACITMSCAMNVLTKIDSILPRPEENANNTLATNQKAKINKSQDGECQLKV